MKTIINRFSRLIIVFCFFSNSLFAQELLFESPENLGLSPERIDKIENVMNDFIDKGDISGAVTLVARHNKVGYFKAFGTKGAETEEKMTVDQIFRIASMSKAITTVGAMALFEKGYFLLDDPVSKYIPEFTDMKVMVRNEPDDKEAYHLVDATSPITIRHLLTQTSGITYGFFKNPYFHKLYKENNISDGLIQTDGTIGDMVKRLSTLPLMNQPGEKFTYGLNTDVLGYLIEILSGMSLDQYLKETIFDPLNMNDTYFFLPDDRVNRLATLNKINDEGILREVHGEIINGTNHYSSDYQYNSSKSYYSGGAGLVSTASDYYKLLQMLLNNGELKGKRILGKKTIELMTTAQADINYYWGKGEGFGFGFSISQGPEYTGNPESEGTYDWSGYFSTCFWVDPQEDLIGII
ncbi:MAG: beta-lactamase family protein, partial [Bacteroidales bacterium]|nr:beta-lactamase family protein [Bacteroidales bacterium]